MKSPVYRIAMKQKSNLLKTLELSTNYESRIGRITTNDIENGIVCVNYQGNPLGRDLPARIAMRDLSLDLLNCAIESRLEVLLHFEGGDPGRPYIKEIFEPHPSIKEEEPDELLEKTIHLVADKIILEAHTEVMIKSGNVKTTYKGEEGDLKTEAENIKTKARYKTSIKSGSIQLN